MDIVTAVWLIIATPKQQCINAENAQRAKAATELVEVMKSTDNVSGIKKAQATLDEIPTLPRASSYQFVDKKPNPKDFNPCFSIRVVKLKTDSL